MVIVVVGLVLGRGQVAEHAVQTPAVVPLDPLGDRDLVGFPLVREGFGYAAFRSCVISSSFVYPRCFSSGVK